MSNIESKIAYYYFVYIRMLNWKNETEDSIYLITTFSNIYFDHLWLMFKLVLQTVQKQGKCKKSSTVDVIKLDCADNCFSPIGNYQSTN